MFSFKICTSSLRINDCIFSSCPCFVLFDERSRPGRHCWFSPVGLIKGDPNTQKVKQNAVHDDNTVKGALEILVNELVSGGLLGH